MQKKNDEKIRKLRKKENDMPLEILKVLNSGFAELQKITIQSA